MPWTALLLVTSLLFGANCGNSAIDIHLRQLYKQHQEQEQQQQQQQQQGPQPQQQPSSQYLHQYQQRLEQELGKKLEFPKDEGFNELSDFISSGHPRIPETSNVLDMITTTTTCNEGQTLSMELPAECLNAFNNHATLNKKSAVSSASSVSIPAVIRTNNKNAGGGNDYAVDYANTETLHPINHNKQHLLQLRTALSKAGDNKNMVYLMRPSNNQGMGMEPMNSDDIATLLPLPMYMPSMYYNEFYEDLLPEPKSVNIKRAKGSISCDCKVTNDLLDLGQQHFPRYLLNAVCQARNKASETETKCWHGAVCKPLEYKVKVLQFRMESLRRDPALVWLPDDLRHLWKFKTVTVTAGCFCGH